MTRGPGPCVTASRLRRTATPKPLPYAVMNQWPRDKAGVRVVTYGPPDADGRCIHTLLWWQDGRKRAQCFHGVPRETRAALLTRRAG